jgi:hypothetical protein
MNGYTPGETVLDGAPDDDVVRGTQFTQHDALFSSWQDGRVLDYAEEWRAHEMRDMLRRYAQGQVVENVLTLPLNQLRYSIKPDKGDRGEYDWLSEKLALQSNQGGMKTPMDLIIGQMTSAVVYKKAYFEKVFAVMGDGHFYHEVGMRPASTCSLIRDPATAAFGGFAQEPVTQKQQEKSKGLPIRIDPKYAFVYLHNIKRDPTNGTSDMEIAYWCYKTQQKVLFLFFNWLEMLSQGKTIVEASDLGRAVQIAGQVRQAKGGSVIPIANTSGANQKVYNLEAQGTVASHYMDAINYLDHCASKSVLAGFVDLTDAAKSGGSWALSKDATDFFLMSRQAMACEMAYFIQNYLLPDPIIYKFGRDAAVPTFEFARLGSNDIDQAVTLLNTTMLAQPGTVPLGLVEILAQTVAPALGMDVDKVAAAFHDAQFNKERELRQQGAPAAMAQMAGVGQPIAMAAKAVRGAQKKGRP